MPPGDLGRSSTTDRPTARRELLDALRAEHPWIAVVARRRRTEGGLADGRRRGPRARRLPCRRRALPDAVDVFIKVDADVDFEPDYCERLVARFADDPTLGIASGTCYELEDGEWVRRTKADSHRLGRLTRLPLGLPRRRPMALEP